MNHPDSAPDPRRKFWWRVVWASVAGTIIPPILAIIGTVIHMVRAFSLLAKTEQASNQDLADDITGAMFSQLWGLIIAAIALIVLIISIIRLNTLPKPAPTLSSQASLEPPT